MMKTTHLVEGLLVTVLASVLGLGLVWYFVIVPARNFRRADPLAIARMAQKGVGVIPDMLEGLNSRDRSYRRACREVLYRLWEHLSPQERKAAAAGQLTAKLTQIDRHGTRTLFRVEFAADIPCTHTFYGKELHLFVNGNHISDFQTDLWMTLPSYNIPFSTTFHLYDWQSQISLDSDDSIAIVGRTWFCLPANSSSLAYGDGEDALRQGIPPSSEFTSGGFYLDWTTPSVKVSEISK